MLKLKLRFSLRNFNSIIRGRYNPKNPFSDFSTRRLQRPSLSASILFCCFRHLVITDHRITSTYSKARIMFFYTLLLQTCLFFLVFCKEGKIALIFNSNCFGHFTSPQLARETAIENMYVLFASKIFYQHERSCGTEFCVLQRNFYCNILDP